MCGRFAITSTPDAARDYFGFTDQPNFPPRYNIAPSEPALVVRQERDPAGGLDRRSHLMRWGLLPGFVKDPKGFPLIFNARSETLLQKASFRNAIKRRRCLFVADAFYEWRVMGKNVPAQPFLVRRADRKPMAFAGLWETWFGPNGEEMDTACIVTTAANGAMSAIHHRLPMIMEQEVFDLWLDITSERVDEALRLLKPPENDVLEFFEVGPGVNKVANDSPDIQLPAALAPAPVELKSVAEKPAKAAKMQVPEQGSLF